MLQEESLPQSYEFYFWGGNENAYAFQTKHDIVYEAKFKPSPYLFGEDSLFAPFIYEFSIILAHNPTEKGLFFDKYIAPTIAAIFEDFYTNSPTNITIYICDSADNRQMIRKLKFDHWFLFFNKVDYAKYDDFIIDKKGVVFSVTLILKEKNPYKSAIVSSFISLIEGYNQGK